MHAPVLLNLFLLPKRDKMLRKPHIYLFSSYSLITFFITNEIVISKTCIGMQRKIKFPGTS